MNAPRTIPSKEDCDRNPVPLRDSLNPTLPLEKPSPLGVQSATPSPSVVPLDGTEGVSTVKKVKKDCPIEKGTGEKGKVPLKSDSFRKGSLKSDASPIERFETRENVSVPKKCSSAVSEKLTVSVWEEDVTSSEPAYENSTPTQTLEIKSRTCNFIVIHRGKKRLCWRECYRNHNVCEKHYPRQRCSFKEWREGEWYCCERKTKTEYCVYHSKGNRDQCKGFTIESECKNRCTMKRIRGSNFCKKHVEQPPFATLCGAPKGKTVCKVVTSRGSYCREHSSLPGRCTNYGIDSRVDHLNDRLWGLFKEYKDTGNQKYLGVMTKHKESRVKLE